jgi:hypothetical protein
MGSHGNRKKACIYDPQALHAHNLAVGIDNFAHGAVPAWMIKAEPEVANALVEGFVSWTGEHSCVAVWNNFVLD